MLITYQIPEQNFELIRDAIGSLLALELASQDITNDVTVWRDRFITFDASELPAINVSYDNTPYDNQNPKTRRGINKYFIDVKVNAKHTKDEKGDVTASLKCERIAGVVAYILSSTEYYMLGFQPGTVQSRWVESLQMGRIADEDVLHTIVCRVTLNVIANEMVTDGSAGELLEEITTRVTLNETDEGYKFELIKT